MFTLWICSNRLEADAIGLWVKVHALVASGPLSDAKDTTSSALLAHRPTLQSRSVPQPTSLLGNLTDGYEHALLIVEIEMVK